jgi:hypothetical protein
VTLQGGRELHRSRIGPVCTRKRESDALFAQFLLISRQVSTQPWLGEPALVLRHDVSPDDPRKPGLDPFSETERILYGVPEFHAPG